MMRPSQFMPSKAGELKLNAYRRSLRAWNPDTKQYLHLSGQGETMGVTWAWRGSREQFKNQGHPRGKYILVDADATTEGAD